MILRPKYGLLAESADLHDHRSGSCLKMRGRLFCRLRETLRRCVVLSGGIACLLLMACIVAEVLRRGLPSLDLSMFFTAPSVLEGRASFLPQILNTAILTGLTLALALPAGIGCALYLLWHAGRSWKTALLETAIAALAGIPSAVYGLFGFLVFSTFLRLRYSLLSGGFTMALLVMPATVKTARQALAAVLPRQVQSAFALGATRAEAAIGVLLPAAKDGLLSAALMAAARVAGESAALLLTAGISTAMPRGGLLTRLLSSGATLAVGLYQSVLEGDNELAFSASVALLLLISLLNGAARRLFGEKGRP